MNFLLCVKSSSKGSLDFSIFFFFMIANAILRFSRKLHFVLILILDQSADSSAPSVAFRFANGVSKVTLCETND